MDWILEVGEKKRTQISNLFQSNPSQGSTESYVQLAYIKSGHWSPPTVISLFLSTAKYYNKMLEQQQGLLTWNHSSQDRLGREGNL